MPEWPRMETRAPAPRRSSASPTATSSAPRPRATRTRSASTTRANSWQVASSRSRGSGQSRMDAAFASAARCASRGSHRSGTASAIDRSYRPPPTFEARRFVPAERGATGYVYPLMTRTPEELHSSLDLDEVSLHWTEAGAGRPTVLLHGLNDSHRTWRDIWPLLPGRRVLMLDLPGRGMSSRPDAPYTVDWNAAQVARWMEHLDLRDADVVGHSYGGGVAQWLLLKCRSRIQRLGLLASGGLGREVYPWLRLASVP